MPPKAELWLLDDVPEFREWATHLLEAEFGADARVRAFGMAAELRRGLQRSQPRLLLLDEVLGVGEDLASVLELIQELPFPTLLMSGLDPAAKPRGLPPGITQRIHKPEWGTRQDPKPFLHEVRIAWDLTTRP